MEPIVIAVRRRGRTSEKILRGVMIGLAVLFLLEGIFFSRGFMLPCAMMALTYYVYRSASVREYEYTLENDDLSIDRITDRGRRRLHEFPLSCVRVLACPDDPAVEPYRRGGSEKVRKYDYTSYREDVPYYTLIAEQGGEKAKFLLDLTPEAIEYIRHVNREAVLSQGSLTAALEADLPDTVDPDRGYTVVFRADLFDRTVVVAELEHAPQ